MSWDKWVVLAAGVVGLAALLVSWRRWSTHL